MRIKKQTEYQLQVAVMKYLAYFYPKILAIHVPNEGKRSKYHAKASGIKAGVSDVLIFNGVGLYNGCAIELKVPPNKPTDKQAEFQAILGLLGWRTCVCYSFDEAKIVIDGYLKPGKR